MDASCLPFLQPLCTDLFHCVINFLSCQGLTEQLPWGPLWGSLEEIWANLFENAGQRLGLLWLSQRERAQIYGSLVP